MHPGGGSSLGLRAGASTLPQPTTQGLVECFMNLSPPTPRVPFSVCLPRPMLLPCMREEPLTAWAPAHGISSKKLPVGAVGAGLLSPLTTWEELHYMQS